MNKNGTVAKEVSVMKKVLSLLLALALLLSCTAFAEEASPALTKDLVVLFTSDVHCGYNQGWGYAGLYAVKEALSKDHHVLLVDNGDATQGEPIGTITEGEAIIDLMNVTGYDLAIPGNHDFDYGMERFFELIEKANFPYISCNFNKSGELIFAPSLMKEFDGVKIGFVGVTTPTTIRSSTPKYFQDENGEFIYGFMQDQDGTAVYTAIQNAVDQLRADGASYVILLAHAGNEEEVTPWKYSDLIANTTGINALLDGHSHDTDQVVMQNKDGEDVVRSACGTKLEGIGALTITTDGKISSELYTWDASIPAPTLLGLENPAAEACAAEATQLDEKLQDVVAHSAVDLLITDPTAVSEEGKPIRIVRRAETNLGDLCADAFLNQAGDADIAIVNGGGVRVTIPAGDITLNNILLVHPFGNYLAVIDVTGQQLLDALEWSVHSVPGEFGGFMQVSGLTFEFDPTLPSPCVLDENQMFGHVDEAMERRVRNVQVGGEPLDPEKVYRLAGTNYVLLNSGDGYTMFHDATVVRENVKLDNQVLIDFMTGTLGGVVGEEYANPYGQGRIVSVNAEE